MLHPAHTRPARHADPTPPPTRDTAGRLQHLAQLFALDLDQPDGAAAERLQRLLALLADSVSQARAERVSLGRAFTWQAPPDHQRALRALMAHHGLHLRFDSDTGWALHYAPTVTVRYLDPARRAEAEQHDPAGLRSHQRLLASLAHGYAHCGIGAVSVQDDGSSRVVWLDKPLLLLELVDLGLAERQADGYYRLTPAGHAHVALHPEIPASLQR